MRKWRVRQSARCVLILLFVGAMLLGWKILWPDELVYKGKPITEWMEIVYSGDLPATSVSDEQWTEAYLAVETAGTNAIPYALKLAWTRDSKSKMAFLNNSAPRKLFNLLGLPKLYDRWFTPRWIQ